MVVQVTRLGSGHKGPRVTARPTLPGRNVVLCPDGEGVYVSRKLVGQAGLIEHHHLAEVESTG